MDILAAETGWVLGNWGANGRELPDAAPDIPADTDLLIVMLGTNDLLLGASPATAAAKMERFLLGLTLPRDKLLLVAPPPMARGEWVPTTALVGASHTLAELYCELAQSLGIRFADAGAWDISLTYDGVHFTEQGHHAFAQGLLTVLHP